MKTQVRNTSIKAIKELEDIGRKQASVYDIISRFQPITNLEISLKLQIPINQVTGRTNELVSAGLVQESHRAISKITNRKSIYWSICED